jgi:hypothetical protein
MEKQNGPFCISNWRFFFELSPGDKALYCLPLRAILLAKWSCASLILGLDIDFVAPSAHPLAKNQTKYDFVAMDFLCKLKIQLLRYMLRK